jgi:hypothetical protein
MDRWDDKDDFFRVDMLTAGGNAGVLSIIHDDTVIQTTDVLIASRDILL